MKDPNTPAEMANPQYTLPMPPNASLMIGKNCATRNVAIQLVANAQLWVAPTASGPTSSEARMKGTGPRPTAKLAAKSRVAGAASAFRVKDMLRAMRMELVPIPEML